MKSKTSKVVVTSGILLLGLGLLGYRVFRVVKRKKKNEVIEEKYPKPETHSKPSKIETVNDVAGNKQKEYYDIPQDSFKSAEELVLQISYRLLETSGFKSAEEFLEKLIFGCGKNILSFEWYSEIPKNLEELNDALRKFGLYPRYEAILEEIYTGNKKEE